MVVYHRGGTSGQLQFYSEDAVKHKPEVESFPPEFLLKPFGQLPGGQ